VLGKYHGFLYSTYDGTRRNADLEIKQTLLSISVKMKTIESRSNTIAGKIADVLGEKQIIYTYLNNPLEKVREHSEIHYGTAVLVIKENGELSGRYFTDRKTTGDLSFVKEAIRSH